MDASSYLRIEDNNRPIAVDIHLYADVLSDDDKAFLEWILSLSDEELTRKLKDLTHDKEKDT